MRLLSKIYTRIGPNSFVTTLAIIVVGIVLTILSVNPITQFIFQKNFYGRNIYYQISFFILVFLFFSFLLLGLFYFLGRFKWFTRIMNQLNNPFIRLWTKIKTEAPSRNILLVTLIGIGVLFSFVLNNVLVLIDTHTWKFVTPPILPTMTPIGADFRAGFYKPAENLFVGKSFQEIWQNKINTNAYPPLETLLGLLFLPFGANTGYIIQVILLLLSNIASLAIAVGLCKKYFLDDIGLEKTTAHLISVAIFFSITFYTFSSYGFTFSIERGNYDIYAILFSLLFLRVLIKTPQKLWVQVLLLSIATHLKIYPAILFVLLFKQHGRKMLLPTLITNLALLFILGPNNALAFLTSSQSSFGIGNKWSWIGNHSSYSFVQNLIEVKLPNLTNSFIPLWIIFTVLPVIIWGVATIPLLKNKLTPQSALLFFAISIPVMDLLPTVSHDYKLVIYSSAIVILIAAMVKCINLHPKRSDYLLLILLFFTLVFIGRSFVYPGLFNDIMLTNKYPWAILLELIILWGILKVRKVEASK